MDKYISVETIITTICSTCSEKNICLGICADTDIIRAIPGADVRPVVRGQWVQERHHDAFGNHWIKWKCSECGYCRQKGWEYTTDGKKPKAKLCEMCGADMREEE